MFFGLEAKLIAGAIAFAALFAGMEYLKHEGAQECRAEVAQAQAAADETYRLKASAAAKDYEQGRDTRAVRYVTITRTVDHEIASAPIWAGELIPPGVRDAIAAAAALAASGPDGGLRVQPTSGGNERTTSGGVRLGTERIRGVFGAASGAG